MNRFKTSDLKPGMIFSEPVYVEGDNLLVPPGVALRDKDIERLVRWEIDEVQTEGQVITEQQRAAVAASRPEAEPQSAPAVLAAVSEPDLVKLFEKQISRVDAIFDELAAGETVAHADIDAVVADLMTAVAENRNGLVPLIFTSFEAQQKLTVMSINATVVALLIGGALDMNEHRITQLATGCLLHDVGMLRIPTEIIEKRGALTEEEHSQMRTHTIHGYRIVSQELKYPTEVGAVALQHHERWDGGGYPQRTKGEDIALAARIVAIADSYQAMVNDRPHRASMIGYSAMKTMLGDNGRRFDPKLLKVFLGVMGIFPIGSIVQLSDSSVCRVVAANGDAPLRPTVDVIIDSDGNRPRATTTINLAERSGTFVAKAIDPRTIAGHERSAEQE